MLMQKLLKLLYKSYCHSKTQKNHADIGCKDGGRRQAKQKKEEEKKEEKKGKKKKGKRTPTVELQAPNGSIEHEEESSIQSV